MTYSHDDHAIQQIVERITAAARGLAKARARANDARTEMIQATGELNEATEKFNEAEASLRQFRAEHGVEVAQ